MSLNQNQFAQIPIQGQLDLKFNPNTISCEVGSAQATDLVPGQAVTIVDSAGGVPKVIGVAADTDVIFGFVNYDVKSQGFAALEKIEVSFARGNVMYMTASAAIARGAQVMVVVASKKIATATTNKRVIGYALDKAAADGDLIRVVVDLPGGLAA